MGPRRKKGGGPNASRMDKSRLVGAREPPVVAAAASRLVGISALGAAVGDDLAIDSGRALVIDAERQALRRAVSPATERDEIREAMTASAATESIGRSLGDELITASREAVAAWHQRRNMVHSVWLGTGEARMVAAIANLERLVGRP